MEVSPSASRHHAVRQIGSERLSRDLRVDVHDDVRLIEGVNEPSKRLGSGKALLDERANEWLCRTNVTRIRILREDRREHHHSDHHPPPIALVASTRRWSNSEARQVGGGSGETTGVFRGFDVSAR